VIFVVDSTDEEKLLFAKDELRRLLLSSIPINNGGLTENVTGSTGSGSGSSRNNTAAGEGLGDVPFLLLYNKRDMVD
jgi:hypothetical protein